MPRRPLLIALDGPSGAGKTTVAREAARAFGWLYLPEAYARLEPPPSLRFSSTRELVGLERLLLVEEARRYREARAELGRGRTVVGDTGFLGPLTYAAGLVALGEAPRAAFGELRRFVERLGRRAPGLPDVLVYLDVPPRLRRSRVANDPRGHPHLLAALHEAVGREERRFYLGAAARLLGRRFVRLPGQGGTERVARRLGEAVRNLVPWPAPRDLPKELLDALDRLARPPGRPTSRRAPATVKKKTPSARDPRP